MVTFTELRATDEAFQDRKGLERRVLGGEVVVVREALQTFGTMDMLVEAAHRGIERSVGREASERARKEGFHRIHEWVAAADIPKMTDAVYDETTPLAPEFLRKFIPGMFPGVESYYFEESPNVRFHIPYDIAEAHKAAFEEFARDHGQGKIAAHGPHRDSWLHCPANGINLWFAIGQIRRGNGLTVFPENYEDRPKYQRSGDIADGEKLKKAMAFDLEPGDVILFHTDHVHGSEVNRLDETRFAVSFRMSFDKPEFPNLQIHPYIYSKWEASVLKPVATLPATLQPSFVRSFAERLRNKLVPALAPGETVPNPPEMIGTKVDDRVEADLADLPVGEVRGLSPALCVARLSETEVVAMTRRCPHKGGDIANGWVDGDGVVCPWHNLPFSPKTGKSACKSLPALRCVRAEITGDKVVVYPKELVNDEKELEIASS